ncbi:hypothetical protein QQS21_002036 [Conoideocrella luteorostrata]|uniref:Uncharacterized protein n=1 Tax=Conoideocrella luteorostrata TaxID=1105319 RepID=A0AAJ0CYR1_9HYPO|nr:hypothetical protein QQS21_002036 [Conoideocrella luteorostrata]
MTIKHFLFSWLFAAVAVADLNRVQVGAMIQDTPQAKLFIKDIKGKILAQPPRVDRRLKQQGTRLDTTETNSLVDSAQSAHLNHHWGYDCYCTMQQFNLTEGNIEVAIVANENRAVVSGSTETKMDIKEIIAVIDSESSGWKVSGQKITEWSGSVDLDIPYFKPSGSYKFTKWDTDENSGGKDNKNEIREEFNQNRVCPANTSCSVQTWTFTTKLRGHCPVIPMVDPVCFSNAKGQKRIKTNRPFFKFLTQNNWMRDNISLAAVNEQFSNWTILGSHFYDIKNKNGSAAGKVQPAKQVDEIFRQSDEYIVNYKNNPSCELLKSPVYRLDGSPQRVTVMIEKAVPLEKRMVGRAEADQYLSERHRTESKNSPTRRLSGKAEPDVKVIVLKGLEW